MDRSENGHSSELNDIVDGARRRATGPSLFMKVESK
jgi:hypothetical protein